MADQTLEILELREKHLTPKQIARKLGMKVSAVSAILRDQAEAKTQAFLASDELPELHKCVIDRSSATHFLGMELSNDDLARANELENDDFDGLDDTASGLAQVIVSQRLPRHQLTIAVFLVDCWCLGVKDAIPARQIGEHQYTDFLYNVELNTGADFVEITFEQAQSVIWGGIDYAESLGLHPHPDFQTTKEILGDRPEPLPIEIQFGRDGQPFYFAGPYDDSAGIIKTLNKAVGKNNYNYVLPMM